MIITQTPLRISLAGGGTDLAAYYAEREGFVVSTAIDKFVYVIVKERFDDQIYLNYMKKEIRTHVAEIEHELDGIKELASGVAPALERGDYDRLGEILHRNWELKRQLASGISDPSLDEMYELARAHGALGGKICGAGGGGFLLVYCPIERSERLEKGMRDYRAMPFRLEPDGSKVIFNYRRDTWK